MRKAFIVAVLVLWSVPASARADVCDELVRQALFDEYESSRSAFEEHAFHQAMCDSQVEITQQAASSGGGLSFAIEGIPIGFSASSASEYRKNYQRLYCASASARDVASSRSYLRRKVVSPAYATAIDNCTRSRTNNLLFTVVTHGANSKVAILKFSYQPSVAPRSNPQFRSVMVAPAGALVCDGAPATNAPLQWRDWYAIKCERAAGRHEGALVSVVTSAGTFDYPFPESAPQPSLESVKKELAKLRASVEATALECKTVDATSPKKVYAEVVASLDAGWFRTGGGCRLPTGQEAGVPGYHNPILLSSEPRDAAGWYCRAGDQANLPIPVNATAYVIGCRLKR